ncbi:MAG: transketolase family protein [Suipraeoptans sp.]
MKIACRKALSEELIILGKKNANIYVVTTDSKGSATLDDFAGEIPNQFIECGIAEQNAVGISGGLASCDNIVFVCSPSPFLSGRSYEQIKIDAVYNNRNVKLIGISGGFSYGTLGFSHHSLQDISMLRTLPGLTLLVPSDDIQTRALVRIMSDNYGPMYMRLGRNPVNRIYDEAEKFTIGKSKYLHHGNDVTIMAVGETVWQALEAAKLLENINIHATVLDMFSVKPIDKEAIIAAAIQTKRIVTVEEHSILGGLGSAVCEIVSQPNPVPIKIIGTPDNHIISGESPDLYRHFKLTAKDIAMTVSDWLSTL